MYQLLKELKIDFSIQEGFVWSERKRYDFYIPSFDLIIETHGSQHYDKTFELLGGRSLGEEQENDKKKCELALSNGIKYYVEIDCRNSDFEYIRNSVMNSDLRRFLDLSGVDWDSVNLNSQKSRYVEFLDLWNEGLSLKEISKITKANQASISRVLRNFERLGICNYDSNRGLLKHLETKKELIIYQFDKEGKLIGTWEGVKSIQEKLGYFTSLIHACCQGRRKTAYGFVWQYKDKS
jgi:hypothetical protein